MKSAGEKLQQELGEIGINVVLQNEKTRESIRTSKGKPIVYNIVTFLEGSKKYPKVHNKVINGMPIAQAIKKEHAFIREEKGKKKIKLPKGLQEIFKDKESGMVILTDIYIESQKEEDKYASIIEIYKEGVVKEEERDGKDMEESISKVSKHKFITLQAQ